MGLGKTLQTIGVAYTMLTQGMSGQASPEALNAVVICPTTLCLNWEAECSKWLEGKLKPIVVQSDAGKEAIKMRLQSFAGTRKGAMLIISCARSHLSTLHSPLSTHHSPLSPLHSHLSTRAPLADETAKIYVEQIMQMSFGLVVCDEAHRLKNPKTALYKALHGINSKMRIMVTGTPIQVGRRGKRGKGGDLAVGLQISGG